MAKPRKGRGGPKDSVRMGIRQLVLEPGQEEEAQKKFAILTLPKGDFWLGTSGSVRCHKPGRGGEKGCVELF